MDSLQHFLLSFTSNLEILSHILPVPCTLRPLFPSKLWPMAGEMAQWVKTLLLSLMTWVERED